MASPAKKLPGNVPGDYFVDSTCIDCGTCRILAPAHFTEHGNASVVWAQPSSDEAVRAATRALLACPTGSIGTTGTNRSKEVMAEFPMELEDGVFYNGFTSPGSFGGSSYFIRHPEGNWLIDSPRFLPHLAARFEAFGGIRYIFLTHRDDVADAARYASKFGARRIIHRGDLSAQPGAEQVLDGEETVRISDDFLVIPVPGHSPGHLALRYREKFLFTGDHVWWDTDENRLGASREVCWFSWSSQKASMERLVDYAAEWVLPGHGAWQKLPACTMKRELSELAARM